MKHLKYIIGGLIVFVIVFLVSINIITYDSDAFATAEKYINSNKLIEEKLNAAPPYKIGLSKTISSGNMMKYRVHVSKNQKSLFIEITLHELNDNWIVNGVEFL